jgi:uncharacterized protein (TIGR02246 family)
MIEHRSRAVEVNDATYAAWNAHDADGVAAVFAEDAVTRDAGSAEVAVGREAVRERAERLFAAFPDLRLERVEGATFTVMNDHGLVAEDHHYMDLAGLLTQLGALG